MKNSIKNELKNLNFQQENIVPLKYFNLDEIETFYDYIKNTELKFKDILNNN